MTVLELPAGVRVGIDIPTDDATFTLTERPCEDRRAVTVGSVEQAVDQLTERCRTWPQAAAVCDDVLRSFDPAGSTRAGVITESLAYSTLQSGPEFARWLAERGPATAPQLPDPVQARRDGNTLHVRFNRPQRHNAFSTDARGALLEALEVARLDPSVDEVVLGGNGRSFCSGGDLAEFGSFADPASAHLARTSAQSGPGVERAHREAGATLPRAGARPGAGQRSGDGVLLRLGQLPSGRHDRPAGTGTGIDPGAGGTVSITRRIGRWRTAYLVLSGARSTRRRHWPGAWSTRSAPDVNPKPDHQLVDAPPSAGSSIA